MNDLYVKFISIINQGRDVPPLFLRISLAYGFWMAGTMKARNIQSVAEWFGSLGFPLPLLNAYMAASIELVGCALLFLGLGTRLIALPLMFIMLVAITTVHWANGFAAGDNGFEIPLYFLIMLAVLLVGGAGRVSLDFLISSRVNAQGKE